jgi:hypothetical protein
MFQILQEGRFTTCGLAAAPAGEGRFGAASSPVRAASLLDLRAIRPLTLLQDGRCGPGGGTPAPWGRKQET